MASSPTRVSDSHLTGLRRPASRQKILLALVVFGLAVEMVVAAAAFTGGRPNRYGWQMYSAVPHVPRVWAVAADGEQRQLDAKDLLVNPRAEIDFVEFLVSNGCRVVSTHSLHIELADGRVEVVGCT